MRFFLVWLVWWAMASAVSAAAPPDAAATTAVWVAPPPTHPRAIIPARLTIRPSKATRAIQRAVPRSTRAPLSVASALVSPISGPQRLK